MGRADVLAETGGLMQTRSQFVLQELVLSPMAMPWALRPSIGQPFVLSLSKGTVSLLRAGPVALRSTRVPLVATRFCDSNECVCMEVKW